MLGGMSLPSGKTSAHTEASWPEPSANRHVRMSPRCRAVQMLDEIGQTIALVGARPEQVLSMCHSGLQGLGERLGKRRDGLQEKAQSTIEQLNYSFFLH